MRIEPQVLLQNVVTRYRVRLGAVRKWLCDWREHSIVSVVAAIIALAIVAGVLSSNVPSADLLAGPSATVYRVAERAGTIMILLEMVWHIYRMYTASKVRIPLFSWSWRFATLWLVLELIRWMASDINDWVQWIEAHHEEALAVSMGIAIPYAALRAFTSQQQSATRVMAISGAVAAMRKPLRRADKDVLRTAIHEVGHLLLYAALPELPKRLMTKIRREISIDDPDRGFVQSDMSWPAVETRSFLRWRMLVHLGGTVAEHVVLGERADGAEADTSEWTHRAHNYLVRGFGDVYFEEPTTEQEIQINRLALNALKAEHLKVLESFLEANRSLLDELTDLLVAEGELQRSDLEPHLARVQFTDGVQRLSPGAINSTGAAAG